MVAKVKVKKTTARKTSAGKIVTSKVEKTVAKTVAKTLKNKVEIKALQRKGRTTTTRLSSKNQVTIPVEILRKAGFKVGDTINCTVDDEGKVLLTHPENPMLQFAGIATGVYDNFDLRAERDSWDE